MKSTYFLVVAAFFYGGICNQSHALDFDANAEIAKRVERGDVNDYDTMHKKFIDAAVGRDKTVLLNCMSPITVQQSKSEIDPLFTYVTAYFSDFQAPVACGSSTMVKDEFGNVGYIYHKAFTTKTGQTKPYKMVLLRENGQVYVSNITPERTRYHLFCFDK